MGRARNDTIDPSRTWSVHRSSRDIDDLVRAVGSNPHPNLRIAEYLKQRESDSSNLRQRFRRLRCRSAVGTEATATLLLGCELSFYNAKPGVRNAIMRSMISSICSVVYFGGFIFSLMDGGRSRRRGMKGSDSGTQQRAPS
jgi:hypothetical protein